MAARTAAVWVGALADVDDTQFPCIDAKLGDLHWVLQEAVTAGDVAEEAMCHSS